VGAVAEAGVWQKQAGWSSGHCRLESERHSTKLDRHVANLFNQCCAGMRRVS
jgi:cellulase/cellobiase CelA1